MRRLIIVIIASVSCFAISSAQTRPITIRMIEPKPNANLFYTTDVCSFDFSFYSNFGLLGITVNNLTDKRCYIEWENARIDNGRVIFADTGYGASGGDNMETIHNPKADESIPAASHSIVKTVASENWINKGFIHSPISGANIIKYGGLREMDVVIPIRFAPDVINDYKFKFIVYCYNPIDCHQLSIGMKAKEVIKKVGKPDSISSSPNGPDNSIAKWYYSSNAIITIKKGVFSDGEVINIEFINNPYIGIE